MMIIKRNGTKVPFNKYKIILIICILKGFFMNNIHYNLNELKKLKDAEDVRLVFETCDRLQILKLFDELGDINPGLQTNLEVIRHAFKNVPDYQLSDLFKQIRKINSDLALKSAKIAIDNCDNKYILDLFKEINEIDSNVSKEYIPDILLTVVQIIFQII